MRRRTSCESATKTTHPRSTRCWRTIKPPSASTYSSFRRWSASTRANRLVPVLITRIPTRANGDISPDGRTIVYHLRRGVRFADGKPLTSADVAFTFAAIVDPRNPVLSEDSYRRVRLAEHAQSLHGRRTLTRSVERSRARTLRSVGLAFGILPKHAFTGTKLQGAAWEDRAFGTGPFRVTQWRRGDRIVLEPNPYFSPRPKLTAHRAGHDSRFQRGFGRSCAPEGSISLEPCRRRYSRRRRSQESGPRRPRSTA